MPAYHWKGVDLSGKAHQGMVQAQSVEHLAQILLQQNIALLEHTTAAHKHAARLTLFKPRIRREQLCDFFERLALLVANGVELVTALATIARSMETTPLGTIAASLAQDISTGHSFQQALGKHPVFAPFIKQLVNVGEQTGHLAAVLEAISRHLRQQDTLAQELKHAAVGPLITLSAAGGLMLLILLFVTPQFEILYQSLGRPLPPATARLIAFSALLRSWHGLAFLAGLLLLALSLKYFWRTPTVQALRERLSITLPIISPVIILHHQVMFMQTLALFIASGVPLSTALENLRALAHNQFFKQDMHKIITLIVEGKSLSNAIQSIKSSFLNHELATLVAVGEKTGTLDGVLANAGTAYQYVLTKKLQRLSTLFAPVLMLIVGLLITGLLIIMYLPIMNLGSLFHF